MSAIAVKAGQVYAARARRGRRRVIVVRVRRTRGGPPHVTAREVKRRRDGLPIEWTTVLTWDGRRWCMPPGYQEAT